MREIDRTSEADSRLASSTEDHRVSASLHQPVRNEYQNDATKLCPLGRISPPHYHVPRPGPGIGRAHRFTSGRLVGTNPLALSVCPFPLGRESGNPSRASIIVSYDCALPRQPFTELLLLARARARSGIAG